MARLVRSDPATAVLDDDEVTARDPLETWPDFGDLDLRQVEVLLAEERRRASGMTNEVASSAVLRQPVLIVEDDEYIRRSLTHVLEDEGFEMLRQRSRGARYP